MPSRSHTSPACPIGIAHGYGFSESGSDIWTREILHALADQGHTVHVVCQVNHPEDYPFVSRAVAYDASGKPRVLLERRTGLQGTVTVHRPDLRVLPTFVRPSRTDGRVACILDLDDADVEDYIERNARVLERVALAYRVGAWSVNHVLLMAQAAQRAQSRGGAPYAILSHGSAIEYVVKRDARALVLARDALRGAARIFSLSPEMDDRLQDVFGVDAGHDRRLVRIPLGTDTSVFQPVPRPQRSVAVEQLAHRIADAPRGRTSSSTEALHDRLAALPASPADCTVMAALAPGAVESGVSAPDADLEYKLRAIGWPAKTILFVGRLIAAKGPAALVAAFPLIASRHPEARLIVAGAGSLRIGLEALVWALAEGRGPLVRQLVRMGDALESVSVSDAKPFFGVQAFVDALDARGTFDAYVQMAHRVMTPTSVVFTGHLDHDALGLLYGLADTAAFPSVVREAGPLVVLESAAAGVFPVGPDFGGTGYSLRSLSSCLPPAARPLLLIRPEAEHRVEDLSDHLSTILDTPRQYAVALRHEAETRFDWHVVADYLAAELVDVQAEGERQ